MQIPHTTSPVGTPPTTVLKLKKSGIEKNFLNEHLQKLDYYSFSELKPAYKEFKFFCKKITEIKHVDPSSIFFMSTEQLMDEINGNLFLKPNSKRHLIDMVLHENLSSGLETALTTQKKPQSPCQGDQLQFELIL